MKFSEVQCPEGRLIDAYDADGVVIGGHLYRQGLIVTPERIVAPWGPAQPSALTVEHLNELLVLSAHIILLGTGRTLAFPAPSLLARMMEQRIGLEVMDTGAACRTYNILLSEGRRVAAGLLAD